MTETPALPVNAIEVRGLKKTYAGNKKSPAKTALRDVVRSASDIPLPPGADAWWRRWEPRAVAPEVDPPWLHD